MRRTFISFAALLCLGVVCANVLGFAFAVLAYRAQALANPLLASSSNAEVSKYIAYANYLKSGFKTHCLFEASRCCGKHCWKLREQHCF